MNVDPGLDRVPDRYRGAVAVMRLDDVLVAHLHLNVQEWTTTTATDMTQKLQVGPVSRTHEMIEWMIVWVDPSDRPYPFIDGIEADTRRLCSELDQGFFVLRGTRYCLEWLDAPERSKVLAEVFGLTED